MGETPKELKPTMLVYILRSLLRKVIEIQAKSRCCKRTAAENKKRSFFEIKPADGKVRSEDI